MNRLQANVLAISLAFGSASFAQSLPIPGNYVSSDHQFNLQITSGNPSNGTIQGTYTTNFSPVGSFTVSGQVGGYSWVNNAQGIAGGAPFYITFGASQRSASWTFVIGDTWNGAWRKDNTIFASGVRSYVDSTGDVQVISLGDRVFTLAR